MLNDFFNVPAFKRFTFQQGLGDQLEFFAIFSNDVLGSFIAPLAPCVDFLVNL